MVRVILTTHLPFTKTLYTLLGQDTSEEPEKEGTLNQTSSLAKLNVKRRHTTSTMYLNCDGAADSSSEEDHKLRTKRKTVSRKLRSPRYAPLSITVTKSPRVQGEKLV